MALILVFALAGCTNQNVDMPGLLLTEEGVLFYSYEQLAQAKVEDARSGEDSIYRQSDYDCDLKSLDYYYVPIYAENRWGFSVGSLYAISMTVIYNSTEQEQGQNDFVLWISRGDGKESFERRINPPIPYEGSPKPWRIDGVYYTEPIYSASLSTYFCWLHDGHYITLRISKALMDFIYENDPGALNGPLFELRQIVLE